MELKKEADVLFSDQTYFKRFKEGYFTEIHPKQYLRRETKNNPTKKPFNVSLIFQKCWIQWGYQLPKKETAGLEKWFSKKFFAYDFSIV